jgi:CheY-like chemotaxis protein
MHARPEDAAAACEQYLPVAVWVNDYPVLGEMPTHVAGLLRDWPQLPIVTCHLPSRADMARRLGVDGFFSKPIVRERLAEAIDNLSRKAPIDSILIIDDDPRMVRLLQRMVASIQGPGCHIIEACGGQEGLDVMVQERPDLVLLDLAMPKVNGYDVLEAIRAGSEAWHTRVILMSGVELGDEGTPVNAITVQSQVGFSLQKALGVTAALIEQLSPRLG